MARESARQPRRSRTDEALFQQAEPLSNQKQVAGELEQQVAQRTAELAEANQKLSKEIGERREIEKRLQESESVLQKALATYRSLVCPFRNTMRTTFPGRRSIRSPILSMMLRQIFP